MENPELYALIHDTSGPANRIVSLVDYILSGKCSLDDKEKFILAIREQATGINKAVDVYYIHEKNNRPIT